MYIEFVIADNFLLTYLAASAATKLSHKRPQQVRMLSAAAVGTAVAVFYPFMLLPLWAEIVVKLSLGTVLCMILYAKTPHAAVSGLLFFGCTFALGGAGYAASLLFAGGGECKLPISLSLGTGAAVYVSCVWIATRLRVMRARAPYNYATEVEIFGEKAVFDGFLDTGNTVFDEMTGLPVLMTDIAVFTGKLKTDGSREFLKRLSSLPTSEIETPAGRAKIYLLQPERITVYSDKRGHRLNAVLGVVAGSAFSGGHELLLNPAAMEVL